MSKRHLLLPLGGALTIAAAPTLARAQTAPTPPERPAPAKPASEPSKELVVTGARSDVIALPDRLSFNVGSDLQVQTGTLADALRAVPGVEVDLEGRLSLRGDPGVTILIDGRPSALMRGEARANALQSMPAGSIERVEVITNPSAAYSPEGSGGIINLVTKQTRKGTRSITVRGTMGLRGRGSAGLSATQSSGALTMTGDVGYRRFTGESSAEQMRSRFDPLSGSLVTSRQDSVVDVTQAGRNARFGLDYDLDKKNRLSGEVNYRAAGVQVDRTDRFAGSTPATSFLRQSDMEVNNRSLGFRGSWRRTMSAGHELVADLEYDRSRFLRELDAVTTLATGAPAFEQIRNEGNRDDYGFKLDYKRPMGAGRSLNLGYEYDLASTVFDYVGGRGASRDALVPLAGLNDSFAFDQGVHALYGTYQFELAKLELQTGLRLEQADTNVAQPGGIAADSGYFRAYPTLHLGYELSAKQKLRGSYSRRIQRPSAQDLNPNTLYIDPLNLRRGNPALLPEVTDSFELAWQLRSGATFYSVTGFYRRSRGGVTDVVTDLGDGVFLSTRANLATARRAGLELLANGKFSKTLTYNASATFLWNEIDPRIFAPRSGTTGTVRANLNWQPTANDFVQLNSSFSGDQLLAQGYRQSWGVLNLGYRRKIDERWSVVLTGQNVLDSVRQTTVIDTPAIRDRLRQNGLGRTFLLGITYTAGGQVGRRRPEPAFEFDQGGAAPQ
jgi:outer membrane receptor protein involved in Fe transport